MKINYKVMIPISAVPFIISFVLKLALLFIKLTCLQTSDVCSTAWFVWLRLYEIVLYLSPAWLLFPFITSPIFYTIIITTFWTLVGFVIGYVAELKKQNKITNTKFTAIIIGIGLIFCINWLSSPSL